MNIKEYISSGILEAYVLGKTTEQETAEVERMMRDYPEVRAELEAIEMALESLAMANPIAPSVGVLDQIHDRMDATTTTSVPSSATDVKMSKPKKRLWGRLGLLTALLFSIICLLITFFNRQQLALENERLSTELERVRDDCDETRRQLTTNSAVLAVLSDPVNQSIPLTATEGFPGNTAHLFVNSDKEVAYFDPLTLPTPAANQQYQLWGIVDGAPVSMGVIDPDANAGDLQEVEYLEGEVQLYAVTLEPRGGSVNPTLEQMYVKS